MEYTIYMKSHCDAPDYEDHCEAHSKEEASTVFAKRLNHVSSMSGYDDYWEEKDLIPYIIGEDEGIISS